MRRGTTSNQTFTLPFVLSNPAKVKVTYKQYGYMMLEKNLEDLTLTVDQEEEKTQLSLQLSEKETLKFYPGYANVQVRILASNGQVYTSMSRAFPVLPMHNNEAMSDA